eukprot:jgi/Astpho2/9652/Aster-x0407
MALVSSNMATDLLRPFFGMRDLALPAFDKELRDLRPIPLDITEDDKAFHVTADIPGVDKDRVDVSVDGDMLKISVTKEEKGEEDEDVKGVKIHRSERATEFQQRWVRLPAETADLDNVKAKFDGGVLKIDIPKKELKEDEKRNKINVE